MHTLSDGVRTLHTYIHTYIHTYMHAYIHTYIHTFTTVLVRPWTVTEGQFCFITFQKHPM